MGVYVPQEVKYFNIAATTAGANELVAAVTGKRIRVLSLHIASAGAADSLFLRSGATNAIALGTSTIKSTFDQTGATGLRSITLANNPDGWFQTAAGEALNLVLTTGNDVAGCGTYIEV